MNLQTDGVSRVRVALAAHGIETEIRLMDSSTHTAQQAADALGCGLSQIAKTLVFIADAKPVLVIAGGHNRVDVQKLSAMLGARVKKADADAVRTHTGFAIGGVPPVGHPTKITTIIDRDLLEPEVVWAAGGHPSTLFPIDPGALVRITEGTVADVAQS